ncbi:MAG: hypothetical protein B7Z80_22850 [Rhodospirillales bacterium 20-64-7]|nr:MAG: hypothetical protein B7Z80_22850 [Rhodospirillales bacterium 20-64-7]
MAPDDINDPLGFHEPHRPEREIPWKLIAFGGCALIAVSLVAFLFVTDNGLGGQPFAIAAIEQPPPAAKAAKTAQDTTGSIPVAAKDGGAGGVTIVHPGSQGALPPGTTVLPSGAIILKVPQAASGAASVADAPEGGRAGLVEHSAFGPLPRIAADGRHPSQAYAAPAGFSTRLPADAPKIAIVVDGMGVSAVATRHALEDLPSGVTLGFAPFGVDLQASVARARATGHEIVLQVPMQGLDGTGAEVPHRLVLASDARRNLDDLHWLMSRFTGYAGVMNYLGGSFLASGRALGPVLHDIGARGLYWFDDGTAAGSRSLDLAAGDGLPARRADVVIDADPDPAAIHAALAQLEALARARGSAVGVATALPASVAQITPFARGLADRGIALTPLSAMMNEPLAGLSLR